MSDSRRVPSNRPSGARRIWRFAGCEFDEARWRLSVAGATVELETKPLELLLEFLRHAGEVLTKDELMDAAWPATNVVEGSLPTAISKLRKALNDDDQTLIATVPRIGYRLTAEVEASPAPIASAVGIDLKAGQAVPGRPQWRLVRTLGVSQVNEVWLAEHAKTAEQRVFKFAADPSFLRYLKREATLSRLLQGSLGERSDFAPVQEWNFETAPFFIEIAYRGDALPTWAEAHGGLRSVPAAVRLDLMVQVCDAVAAAHALGVLHRDLKPANIVVSASPEGGWRAAVVDFGSADLTEPHRLAALAITNVGFESAAAVSANGAGTAHYLAPEQHAGGPASIAGDVFALGVILYQIVVGDFAHPLSAGWEQEVADPLLREDIGLAAAGDPKQRLASAADLAARLRALDSRRVARERAQAEATRKAALERELVRTRARRPWVIAAGAALALGLAGFAGATLLAVHQRDEARRQGAIAAATGAFLADDLLGRGDPARTGVSRETLLDATRRAEPEIDLRFRHAPLVAARLHHTLARVFEQHSDWAAARQSYDRAERAYELAHAADSDPAAVVRLQHAAMEALSFEKGSVERAKTLVDAEQQRLSRGGRSSPELAAWLASARGMIGLAGGDIHVALDQFGKAARLADSMPAQFDERVRNDFHQRHAFTYIRLGDGAAAEAEIRPLLAAQTRLLGPANPDVLILRMNLGQAYLFQQRYAEAVATLSAVLPELRRQLGPGHRLVQQTLAARQQAYGSMGRYAEAVADGRALYAISFAGQGLTSFRAIAALSDLATSECRVPDLAAGVADARKAYAASRAAFGATAALTQGVGVALAQCLIEAGDEAGAAPLLADVDRKAVGDLASDPHWGANVDLAQAEIAARQGRWASAARALQATGGEYSKTGADRFQAQKFAALSAQVQAHGEGQ